jgi:hypothetical protein
MHKVRDSVALSNIASGKKRAEWKFQLGMLHLGRSTAVRRAGLLSTSSRGGVQVKAGAVSSATLQSTKQATAES